MPFKSQAQRRYLEQHHPEIAKKWAEETTEPDNLPERVSPPSDRDPRANTQLLSILEGLVNTNARR